MSTSIYKTVDFGKSKTGLATVGYTVNGSRVTAGVTELAAGSGVYGALVSVPDGFQGSIVWDTGGGTPSYAPDEINLLDTPGTTTLLTRVPNLAPGGTVDASPAPTATSFNVTGLPSAVTFTGKRVHFTSGNLIGFDLVIAADSGGSPRTLTFTSPGWQVAPAAGDSLVIFA